MADIELLAPAGNWEKLKVAIAYGADAVYFGGPDFSLRRHAGNFNSAQLPEVISYCRNRQVKAYLAVNCYLHPRQLEYFSSFLLSLRNHPPDALIVSDPGAVSLCRELLPDISLHLSTQANTTNQQTAKFWQRQGIRRVNLARELSLEDIAVIHRENPNLELEVFVHGAMCMAYSGRCLLSSVLTGRSANRGDCAQPCRWGYALVEETRPGEYFPLEEDQRGSYVFNSRDLCLLEWLPALKKVGATSMKIEGRMKSSYYVAVVTRVYRRMLDLLARGDEEIGKDVMEQMKNELTRVSHRGYTHGFIDGCPDVRLQNVMDSAYVRDYQYVALVLEGSKRNGQLSTAIPLAIKDQVSVGDHCMVMDPAYGDFAVSITRIVAENGIEIDQVHPGCRAWVDIDHGFLQPGQILYRRICPGNDMRFYPDAR